MAGAAARAVRPPEFLSDPAIWICLLTLVVLEIILGIDNLVFIAILAIRGLTADPRHA